MPPVPADDPPKKRSPSDYIFGKAIGEGSFSTVYLAKDTHTSKEYAIKVLDKQHIVREKKMQYVSREKEVLLRLAGCNQLFVKLYCTFQDSSRLYFVMTYAKHGEFLQYINAKLSMESIRYYAAELVLALEILNNKKIIHRDLKPENILLDENWHILITDFGSAKLIKDEENNAALEDSNRRRNSFVGTAQYVTPEVLTNQPCTYATDLWALGCVVYQMISQNAPFQDRSEYLIFKKILGLDYEFPENFDETAEDLVRKLLIIAPEERLGTNDAEPYSSLRTHSFFDAINWDNMGPPPKMQAAERGSDAKIPEELEPGFDGQKASRLQMEMICPEPVQERKVSRGNRNVAEVPESEVESRLELQRRSKWHEFVDGCLILKQGLIDKKKGLFPRRRMFLLTRGPRLFYVDPINMVLKGEIPWSADVRTEAKNFKVFHVHTPNRTYYLEDSDGYALEWCKAIEDVKAYYYPQAKCEENPKVSD